MKPKTKKIYREQFSWLNPEEKPEEKTKELTEEISEEKIDRRKVLNNLIFWGVAAGLGGYITYKIIDDRIDKSKLKIIKDVISGEILSAYVEAPFDIGKEALEKEGYEIISLEENARLRMQEGYNAFVFRIGDWVREAVIYVPNKRMFLTKNSPIMENAKEATDCHRKGIEYYLTDRQVEKALENAVEITKTKIPTNKFKDDELTVFAFGDSAEEYGWFLKDYRLVYVLAKEIEDKPFARQVFFGALGSLFCVNPPNLDHDVRVRGTLKTPR